MATAKARVEAATKAVRKLAPAGLDDEIVDHLESTLVSLVEEEDAELESVQTDFEETALAFLEDAGISEDDAKAFCKKVTAAIWSGDDSGAKGAAGKASATGASNGSRASENCLLYCPNILLMYGGSPQPLLKNATIELVRGHRYGVIGSNGSGKTTLMSRLAAKSIVGFPQELVVVHLRHETILQGVKPKTTAKEYARLRNAGSDAAASDADISKALKEVGFDNEDMLSKKVLELSGGWQMRLALACAMAEKANLLLLDEPTNHLDAAAVQWLVDFINRTCIEGPTGSTALVVSHDPDFLDNICTDIVHFTADAKLVYHVGGFTSFTKEVLQGDEAKAKQLLEVASKGPDGKPLGLDPNSLGVDEPDRLQFPAPEKIAGDGKYDDPVVLTVSNMTYQHKGAETPILRDVNLSVRVSSRIAIVGKNGSGKSTLLSIVAGRLKNLQSGQVETNHKLRLVYIGQHSEKQLADYMNCTPYEYLQLRFKRGYDSEMPLREMPQPDHKQRMRIKQIAQRHGKRGKEVELILSRQIDMTNKRALYEVSWKDLGPGENSFEKFDRLKSLGVEHMVHHFNQLMMDAWGEAPERPLTDKELTRHLVDFGLPEDAAQNRRITMLSSGQKVRLLMAASFWTVPHIVCFDEPTNYLDVDSVEALATALRKFKGGYLVVSHNQKFIEEISEESWEVADGSVTVRQLATGKKKENGAAADTSSKTAAKGGYPAS
eukprot:TRINITY_DN2986_c0_g1_i1.p1 TRINITY_DN2986_c0_g1~~TRINITY_DN2986_c0_g1_i1.p1  ORF type:complete len:720 (+),score=175.98 TRINITY_DN2986_c0_g1_i1:39-2198(+)